LIRESGVRELPVSRCAAPDAAAAVVVAAAARPGSDPGSSRATRARAGR